MNLHKAAEKGNLKRVKLLLEQGGEKDASDGLTTPLREACENCYFDVVQYLVEQGASLDKAGNNGWTPLLVAAYEGHLEIVRYLLELCQILAN